MAEMQSQEGPSGPINGGAAPVGVSSESLAPPSLGTKRQRRPSVRLGDIGGQPSTLSYDSYVRRTKQWNESRYRNPFQRDNNTTSFKASKTRPLTNLVNGGDCLETLDGEDRNISGDGNLDSLAVGNRKGKDSKVKRGGGGGGGTKRVRSNWVSRVEEGTEAEDKFSVGEDGGPHHEGYRDFDPDASESPLREQSPIQSLENLPNDLRQTSDRGHGNEREVHYPGQKRLLWPWISESRDHDAVELDGPSDTDARDWKCGTSEDRNANGGRGICRSLEDGVRIWLSGIGLGRYAPVFEIHEVDDEVLPFLTLEDLKDMGINAVGSRRKMYCAIQKLAKGFS